MSSTEIPKSVSSALIHAETLVNNFFAASTDYNVQLIEAAESLNQITSFITKPLNDVKLYESLLGDVMSGGDRPEQLAKIVYHLFDQISPIQFNQHGTDERLRKIAELLMKFIVNMADASVTFGVALCRRDEFLTTVCRVIDELKDNPKDEIWNILLELSINAAYNLLIHEVPENFARIAEYRFVENIKDLIRCDDKGIRILAIMFMTYAVTEENAVMLEETDSPDYLISTLKAGLKDPHHRSDGYSVEEVAKALGRLAKNGSNKLLLVERRILPVMDAMLKSDYENHQELALLTLWTLAFDEKNRVQIEAELGSAIAAYAAQLGLNQLEHHQITSALSGLQWVLKQQVKRL